MKFPTLLTALAALTLPASAQKMQTPAGEAPGPWILGTIGVGKGEDGKTPKTTAEVAEGNRGGRQGGRVALKGLAIKVGEKGEAALAYDLDLCRMVGAWTGKFMTPMNLMSRGEYPTAMGEVAFTTGEVPGFLTAAPGTAGVSLLGGNSAAGAGDSVADAGNSVAEPGTPSPDEKGATL